MKKVIAILLALCLCAALCACNQQPAGNTNNASDTTATLEETTAPPTEATEQLPTETTEEPSVQDHFDTATSYLICTGAEKGHPGLNDYGEENLWIIKFDFSNKTAKPAEAQDYYTITFFQNNVEVDVMSGIYSTGGDHYELCSNYWKKTYNGGAISFARGLELPDTSPVTIFMEDKETGEIAMITVDLK